MRNMKCYGILILHIKNIDMMMDVISHHFVYNYNFDSLNTMITGLKDTFGNKIEILSTETKKLIGKTIPTYGNPNCRVVDFINKSFKTIYPNAVLVFKVNTDRSIEDIYLSQLIRTKLKHNESMRIRIDVFPDEDFVAIGQRRRLEDIEIPQGHTYPFLIKFKERSEKCIRHDIKNNISFIKSFDNLGDVSKYLKRHLKINGTVLNDSGIAVSIPENRNVWRVVPEETAIPTSLYFNAVVAVENSNNGKCKIHSISYGGDVACNKELALFSPDNKGVFNHMIYSRSLSRYI